MTKKIYIFLGIFVFFSGTSYAQTIPAEREASGVQASTTLQDKDLKLRETIKKERETAAPETFVQPDLSGVPDSEKVLISRVEVTGAKLIAFKDIRKIVAPFEGKTLSIREMQELANRITDLYRQKGYITSRAIIPPQKVQSGVLQINIVEGSLGKITVQGNKYYSSALIKRRIALKEGGPLDYKKLQTNLSKVNQYRDRKVKTVLTPGQVPGSTDLVLNVKDNFPLHVGFTYDNYGSRYLRKDRYQGTLTHNNLTGHDDIMTLTYQIAEGHNTYRLGSVRYIYPLTNKTELGVFVAQSQLQLGREYADLEARGKSKIYSIYLTHDIFNNDLTDIAFNVGFDYKDVFNFQLGEVTSRDRLRVPKTSLKVDTSDSMGRTIINDEVSMGIESKWGSLEENDSRASRAGSGGKFVKNVLDVLRLHKMPAESVILLKGQLQNASHILTASEQFQIGGIANVRAYPAAEVVGDDGQSLTGEWSFPVYMIPKNVQAPFSKAKLYDALRIAVFYDWARASLRRPGAGEAKSRDLNGWGVGLRYDLPESFSIRIDTAWALDERPSDNARPHTWVKVSKEF